MPPASSGTIGVLPNPEGLDVNRKLNVPCPSGQTFAFSKQDTGHRPAPAEVKRGQPTGRSSAIPGVSSNNQNDMALSGLCKEVDDRLRKVEGDSYFHARTIIAKSHQRGEDELVHRSIKELATKEQLPLKRFGMNRAYYYLLVITHFLFETYKRDVAKRVIPVKAYPNTLRRLLIDFAAKLTSQARYNILKVCNPVCEALNIQELWTSCQSPPVIQLG